MAKRLKTETNTKEPSSSGHKLGQLIGDWFEEYVAFPLLQEIAEELSLFIDSRFLDREQSTRTGKISWEDLDGNSVDYDFVFELNGDNYTKGIPVAFFETFWRRGARHSKEKARDDSGKLVPMAHTYPTARIVGILSAGDFTSPAREFVKSRGIDLFYIEKEKILDAWKTHGFVIDYDDRATEETKNEIYSAIEHSITKEDYLNIAKSLNDFVGLVIRQGYKDRIKGTLAALPQSYTIVYQKQSKEYSFPNAEAVKSFLGNVKNDDVLWEGDICLRYEIDFSDGRVFQREHLSMSEAIQLHEQMDLLVRHITKIYKR